MKRYLLFLVILFLSATSIKAQTILFEDDFESGAINWDISGTDWDVTDEYASGGSQSFTDSPYDDTYTATEVQTATMIPTVNLSTALDADVQFNAIIDLEEGFDYCYLDVTHDGGVTWITVATFNGEDMFDWTAYTVPLGGFAGYEEVYLRFRFDPDDFVEYDGIYIDDFRITKYNIDHSPPLILHTAPVLYEGTLEDNNVTAEIIDISDISAADLFYRVDGSAYIDIPGINTSGDDYLFTIPQQDPGAVVDYYIVATDDFTTPNTAISDTFTYIAGNYIKYDDAVVDYVYSIGDFGYANKAAVKFTLTGSTNLVAAVLRNYIDPGKLNDSITVHVWADSSGYPGADLITPFTVFPEATFSDPNKGTKVDLRPYSAILSGISGDVFIGYTSDSLAWLSYTNTGTLNRSIYNFGGYWYDFYVDFHFRAVTSDIAGAPVANFSYDLAAEPVVEFTDLSTLSPTSWYWDFGDGITSTSEDPVHEYLLNGLYNVCLTATNAVASDMYCESITIDSYAPPVADFTFFGDPTVTFTDISANTPTSWNWIFGDGFTSTEQNPVHTFATNDIYNVCMSAFNASGGTTKCYAVTVDAYEVTPEAGFTYVLSNALATFTDASTNAPAFWDWDFGDGNSSTLQNPLHLYDALGVYTVCLTAGNGAGNDSTCKTFEVIVGIKDLQASGVILSPNPADDALYLHTENITKGISMTIYNATGQTIEIQETVREDQLINVRNYAEGTYFMQLKFSGKIEVIPFVIEH